ncbi:amino acid permease [Weissella confusa]|uniref:Amino acid permease n=1 Tax=Weissella confusa TaxID=1583 RepID=A0A923SMR0_WEICO|nr:amino acid permease [Weissella confusa]
MRPIFYTAAFFGVFMLRRQVKQGKLEEMDTLFKTPLFPITPLVAIFGALFVIGSTVINDFTGAAISIVFKMLSFPRMAYAMSLDGLFPKYLSKLTRKTQEPTNAIATVTIMTLVLAIFYTSGVDRLSDIAIFTI